ncbi:MAG: hypothetical protein R6T85_11690 [Egibacteraceae bacterium]
MDRDEYRATTATTAPEVPRWYAAAVPALLSALVVVMALASHTAT